MCEVNKMAIMHHDVFISYSTKETSIAVALCHYLEENRIRCWMAPRDIPPAKEYAEVIEGAIRTSRFVVVVISLASQNSQWVRQEVNLAISEGKIVMPVRIDETQLTGAMRFYLNDKHWIDAFPNPDEKFFRIRDALFSLMAEGEDASVGGIGIGACTDSISTFLIQLKALREVWMFIGFLMVFLSLAVPTILFFSQQCSVSKGTLMIGTILIGTPLGLLLSTGISPLKWCCVLHLIRKSFSAKGIWKSVSDFMVSFVALGIRMYAVLFVCVFPMYFCYGIIVNAISFQGGSVSLLLTLLVNVLCVGTICVACMKSAWALFMERYEAFRFTKGKVVKWVLLLFVPMLSAVCIVGYAAQHGIHIDTRVIPRDAVTN